MEEAIRSMLMRLKHPGYVVDFSVEETPIVDPVTERDYFPVKIDIEDVQGWVVKGGQYFPPDEKGMRALALFLWDDEEHVYVRYLVQKVSPEGKVLESVDQTSGTTDYDWRNYSCLWQESQDAIFAELMELSAKGYRVMA
ncbi:hypothetical protein SELMODRAFT_422379 [Selaginella moellendorffii]|uniref:Uncharacterized protein n=1 Tax=Selaginella moellendorffii TaxID=88036 RepID=D8SI76_SELML|nr:uncharacterized protein LOC9654045 [Selaginella moellendorffii]EFJ15924.1 hypothetical protein SELMODRAFT_422379 [Selaginella moellendorffii]|eukprot:XP_002983115.1 uncharacterized protein LOC9654045 [Selaginella moellendorffii]